MTKIPIARVAGALALAAFVLPSAGFASSHTGSGGTTTGFVCPVFNSDSQAGAHNPNKIDIYGGDTSIVPGTKDGSAPKTISISTTATNGDGSGAPDKPHSSTGDSDYTAVWNTGG